MGKDQEPQDAEDIVQWSPTACDYPQPEASLAILPGSHPRLCITSPLAHLPALPP